MAQLVSGVPYVIFWSEEKKRKKKKTEVKPYIDRKNRLMAHPDVSNRKPIVNAFTAKAADSFVSYYVRTYIGIYLILSTYIRDRKTDSKTSYSGDHVGFFFGNRIN